VADHRNRVGDRNRVGVQSRCGGRNPHPAQSQPSASLRSPGAVWGHPLRDSERDSVRKDLACAENAE
jgi:hypothetical protein